MESNLMVLSDEILDAMVEQGDDAAFNALMERYMLIIRYKSRVYFCAGVEKEDLMQEARIGLYNACRNYECGKNASFATFASLCITRRISSARKRALNMGNSLLNNYKNLYKDDSLDELCDEDFEALSKDFDSVPENYVVYAELKDTIKRVVDNDLSEIERLYFSDYVNGYKCAEIADKYGAKSKSVDNALSRAKKKVRECVESLG